MFSSIIVDDDSSIVRINKSYIERHGGYNIRGVFTDAEQALGFLKVNRVDLVFLDYYMPKLDGLQFIAKMKKMNVPSTVIMVTAANDAESIGKMYYSGVFDVLIKPFDYKMFSAKLDKYTMYINKSAVSSVCSEQNKSEYFSCDKEKYPDEQMQSILVAVDNKKADGISVDEISTALEMSKITVRQAVNCLVETGVLTSLVVDEGKGPIVKYRRK